MNNEEKLLSKLELLIYESQGKIDSNNKKIHDGCNKGFWGTIISGYNPNIDFVENQYERGKRDAYKYIKDFIKNGDEEESPRED